MKNPAVFNALIALGIFALVVGLYMFVGMNFHGKAFAVMALGIVCLVAGIAGKFVTRPRTV